MSNKEKPYNPEADYNAIFNRYTKTRDAKLIEELRITHEKILKQNGGNYHKAIDIYLQTNAEEMPNLARQPAIELAKQVGKFLKEINQES